VNRPSHKIDSEASAFDRNWSTTIAGGVGHLPKEYHRNLFSAIDKRFLWIWLISFAIHFGIASYFAAHPPEAGYQQHEITRIQKQFATYLLEKQPQPMVVEPEQPAAALTNGEHSAAMAKGRYGTRTGNPGGASQGSGRGEGSSDGATSSQVSGSGSASGTGLSYREQIAQEVSSKGLLGLLTGSGSHARGDAVADVLGKTGSPQGDLDNVLGKLDGMKTTGRPTAGGAINPENSRVTQKPNRAIETEGIDELIGDKGGIASVEIQRSHQIVLEQVSEVADERGVKTQSRDADQVSEVVNRHNASIQYCYQRELKQNPDLKGKLVVRFTIDPSGSVKDVKVISSTLNSPSIERCVISRIKRWDDFGAIDPAKGDATFRQVYTFGY